MSGRNSWAEDRDAHTRSRDLLNNTGHQAVITADSSRKQVIYDVVNGGAGTTLLWRPVWRELNGRIGEPSNCAAWSATPTTRNQQPARHDKPSLVCSHLQAGWSLSGFGRSRCAGVVWTRREMLDPSFAFNLARITEVYTVSKFATQSKLKHKLLKCLEISYRQESLKMLNWKFHKVVHKQYFDLSTTLDPFRFDRQTRGETGKRDGLLERWQEKWMNRPTEAWTN